MPRKRHFEAAAIEVSRGTMDAGLWAMALAGTSGNQEKAVAMYLKLRAEELERAELGVFVGHVAKKGKEIANDVLSGPISLIKAIWSGLEYVVGLIFVGIMLFGIFNLGTWLFKKFL